jgi:hypothetical protein
MRHCQTTVRCSCVLSINGAICPKMNVSNEGISLFHHHGAEDLVFYELKEQIPITVSHPGEKQRPNTYMPIHHFLGKNVYTTKLE